MPKTYGWRGRIGLMTPEINTVSEYDFNRFTPDGVSVHTARMPLPDPVDANSLEVMNEDIERAAGALARAHPDVIVYGVTAGTFTEEVTDEDVERRIEDETGIDALATTRAVREALEAVDVTSVAVCSPYIGELQDLLTGYLDRHGIEVVDVTGEEFETGDKYGTSSPELVYQRAKAIDHPDADGVFISGMEYHGAPIIERLEADIGKPAVSAVQSTIWGALREIGVSRDGIRLGSLFEH